jgi:hypothetical protein
VMLDRYTNLLADLPDNQFTLAIEGSLMFIKVVGHASLDALPGLKAMLPHNEYLNTLNARVSNKVDYYAMTADYQPTNPGWIRRFCKHGQDLLVDTFFEEPNDGVVPTSGGYSANATGDSWTIPQSNRREFMGIDGISHSTFFNHPAVNEQLLGWLSI